MKSIKNYFLVFCLTYIAVLITKLLFAFIIASEIDKNILFALLAGYKFDFATSAFIAFFATLFDFSKKAFVFVASFLIVAIFLLQLADILYFKEASRHIGYEILDFFVDAKSLIALAMDKYFTFVFSSLIATILLFLLLLKLFSLFAQKAKVSKSFFLSKLFLTAVSVFFIRGMFQHIPLNPWQANQIGNNKLSKYLVNGAYNAVYSAVNAKKKLKPYHFSHPKKLSLAFLYQEEKNKTTLPILHTKPNIVLFFLESWSASLLKPYGGEFDPTPNFDVILQHSLRSKFMIASGHRTTEGIFAVLSSYPNPLGKSVAKTQLQNFHYYSLIDILNSLGYSSAFFQGTAKETSGTGSLAQNLGFAKSYGKRDIKKRIYKENNWGVQDIDLYNFVLDKLHNSLKEPFVIAINGATTHDIRLPSSVKKIDFTNNKALNDNLNTLHFADYALGIFVKKMLKKYPNTIFVFFADHCGGNISGTLKNYMIPFAIYSPLIKAKYYDAILSQRDIAPTLLDLAVGDYKKIAPYFTGKSLIQDKKFFADYFHNGILGWIEEKNLIEINLSNNTYNCFVISAFSKKEKNCSKKEAAMKDRALYFTYITQKLLFEGKTEQFYYYRKQK